MTTKFLDNKICTFDILLAWRFPRKIALWDEVPLCPPMPPPPPPPLKSANFIFIVVSPSLIFIAFERFTRITSNLRSAKKKRVQFGNPPNDSRESPESAIRFAPSGQPLIFFSLPFWKTARKQGFLLPAEPLKSLGKKGKNAQNRRKTKKARKRRVGSKIRTMRSLFRGFARG